MSPPEEPTRIVLPMTSIANAPGEGEVSQPWVYYLTVIGEQAQIALRHLLAVWEMEGEPADLNVWSSNRTDDRDLQVWSHLQGAMFAGIVLTRMFDPRVAGPGRSASPARRAAQEAKKAAADARARRLRELLDVDNDSPLLQIRGVRDALEHFDERMDQVAAAGDVASVSDFTIALGGRFVDIDSSAPREAPDGGAVARHLTMRQFGPDFGVLYFGDELVDLFAYEAAPCTACSPRCPLPTGRRTQRRAPDRAMAPVSCASGTRPRSRHGGPKSCAFDARCRRRGTGS